MFPQKHLFSLLSIVAVVFLFATPVQTSNLVVDGKLVSIQLYPFAVFLGRNTGSSVAPACLGVLISESHILTVASCCDQQPSPDTALLGQDNWNAISTGESIAWKSCVVHPDYSNQTIFSNIAIIELTRKATATFAKPVKLALDTKPDVYVGMYAESVGWGSFYLNNNNASKDFRLRKAQLEVISNSEAITKFNRNNVTLDVIPPSQVFAKYMEYGFPYKGDAGSPLLLDIKDETAVAGSFYFTPTFEMKESDRVMMYSRTASFKQFIDKQSTGHTWRDSDGKDTTITPSRGNTMPTTISETSTPSTIFIILGAIGFVLFMIGFGVAFLCIRRRKAKAMHAQSMDEDGNFHDQYQNYQHYKGGIAAEYTDDDTMLSPSYKHHPSAPTEGYAMDNYGGNGNSRLRNERDVIPASSIEVIKVVGGGSYGEVYLAKYAGANVVLKSQNNCTEESFDSFYNEIQLLKTLNHPNIVQYLGITDMKLDYKSKVCLVCEYMPKGDLKTALEMYREIQTESRNTVRLRSADENHRRAALRTSPSTNTNATNSSSCSSAYSDSESKQHDVSNSSISSKRKNYMRNVAGNFTWKELKLCITADIASGLMYMHELTPKVIHRDLKSPNVLLGDHFQAKIGDFGTSKAIEDITMTAIGSALWMAPEVFIGDRFNEKADVYSFGIILSELITHQIPYSNVLNQDGKCMSSTAVALQVVQNDLRPNITLENSCTPWYIQDLFHRCVAKDPAARPSAKEILDILDSHRRCSVDDSL